MGTSAVHFGRLATAKILLVDDSSTTRNIVRRMLRQLGVQTIHEANSANSGLETLRSVAPDVVILDWEMPDLSGGQFLRTVRSPDSFPYPETPIIVVSGHSEEKVVTEAFCAGVNEYLIKPISPHSLGARLTEVLLHPRKMVRIGAYYGPEPRRTAALLQPQAVEPSTSSRWLV